MSIFCSFFAVPCNLPELILSVLTERRNMATSMMTPSKRMASALVGTLLGIAVVAGVGFALHMASVDPSGKLYATKSSESIDVNGKTFPKASVTLNVYADNGQEQDLGGKQLNGKENSKDWVHYGQIGRAHV